MRCVATTTRTSTANRLVAADALDFSFLQHAQKLCLHRERHVADLVEEKRAVMGLLEFSNVPGGRAGERAFFVAEQLRFHQFCWNRGAVERNERAVSARAFLVQRAGDQFLAGAGFAADADARLARRNVLDLCHHFAHRRACPNDLMTPQPALQIAVFFFEMFEAQRVFDGQQELFGGDGLLDEIHGAQPSGAHGHFDRGLAGHHHNGR